MSKPSDNLLGLEKLEKVRFVVWYEFGTGSGRIFHELVADLKDANKRIERLDLEVVAIFPIYDSEWMPPRSWKQVQKQADGRICQK